MNFGKKIRFKDIFHTPVCWQVFVKLYDKEKKLIETKKAEKFDKDKGAMFYKGTFKANSQADCFVHLDGFEKGYVWVNGFNLGRYWKVGPQKSLYLPGCLLKEENAFAYTNEGLPVQKSGAQDGAVGRQQSSI